MIKEVKRKKIKEAAIEKKDQRWHCRNRITLVFGSNDIEELHSYIYSNDKKIIFKELEFHQAKSKAIEELLDNCIDEFYRGNVTEVHVSLSEDGKSVTVEDNGIGFPIDKIDQVYSEFRTGSKFKDEDLDHNGYLHRTLGQNGVGASATCLTSDLFEVTVRHFKSKKMRTVTFKDGALHIKKSKITKFKGHSGVKVTATLSPEVYGDNLIDRDLLRKRVIDLSFNNPGLTFYLDKEKFISKKGLSELAELTGFSDNYLIGEESITQELTLKDKKVKGMYDISLSFSYDKKLYDKERIISFVNSTPTFDGGFHHDRVRRIFINKIKDKLERPAKKEKIQIIDSDILTGTCFVIGLIMPNPRFESQTKRKLVRDYPLEKSLEYLINDNIEKFFRKNKEFLEVIIDRAKSRNKFQELKDAAKQSKQMSRKKIDKLLDANEKKDRSKCVLFICEGDSAIGGLRSARNKLTQGGIALKGKPMNVSQASVKDILNNKELSDIMGAVGLTLGQPADIPNMRFAKIVFLADSDVDGSHINTLLANFFFQFWPELYTNEVIQVARAPLFEIIVGNKKHFADSIAELEELKKTLNIKSIQRNKGLGEMSEEAFAYLLKNEDFTILKLDSLEKSKNIFDVCFGKDTDLRKNLLLAKGRKK